MFVCLSWYSFLNSSSAQVPLKIKLWNYIVVSLNTFIGISLSFSKDFKSDRVNYIFFWFSFSFLKIFWNWLSTENFTVFIISFLKFTTRENSDSWPLVSSPNPLIFITTFPNANISNVQPLSLSCHRVRYVDTPIVCFV